VSLTKLPDMQRGLGDGPPVGSRGKAPVGGLGDKVPQKLNDIFALETILPLKFTAVALISNLSIYKFERIL